MKIIIALILISLVFLSCSFNCTPTIEAQQLNTLENTISIFPQLEYTISDSAFIKGKLIGEQISSIPFVNVIIVSENIGTQSNEKGEFIFKNVTPGVYDITISQVGYTSYLIKDLEVIKGKSLNIKPILMSQESVTIDKPIIYLYPTIKTDVKVELDYDGKLLFSYPKYNDFWEVTAKPNGTLTDKQGKEYYALFWEGIPNNNFSITEGFVINGNETINFLEKALIELGLNQREANEFIIYWLPKLEHNPYNLIHFSTTEYEQIAKLKVEPKPDTVIRVMMVVKPLEKPITIKEQNISLLKKERKGFTIVEWGGCLIK